MKELEPAYRATSYFVNAPDGRVTIRVGHALPLLDALLRKHRQRCWAFVTAANPGSLVLTEEQNHQRHADLEWMVRREGYEYYLGEGVDDEGIWAPEKSLLIIGITAKDAGTVGNAFGQNAILVGELGAPARLLWL